MVRKINLNDRIVGIIEIYGMEQLFSISELQFLIYKETLLNFQSEGFDVKELRLDQTPYSDEKVIIQYFSLGKQYLGVEVQYVAEEQKIFLQPFYEDDDHKVIYVETLSEAFEKFTDEG